MKTRPDGKIVDVVEKPAPEELEKWRSETPEPYASEGKHYLASMGIYIFNRDTLHGIFEKDTEATDFGKEFIPAEIKSGKRVYSYEFGGYWTDIGTIRSFYEANLDLTRPLPQFNLYDNEHYIYTRARLLPASKLTGTTLEATVIAEGCIISASRIARSVIGIRSRIGNGTTIEDSIVFGNDLFPTTEEIESRSPESPLMGIGDRCYISHTIIDKDCRIGNDVRIVGGTHLEDGRYDKHYVVDGIVIIPKGEVLPDGYHI